MLISKLNKENHIVQALEKQKEKKPGLTNIRVIETGRESNWTILVKRVSLTLALVTLSEGIVNSSVPF